MNLIFILLLALGSFYPSSTSLTIIDGRFVVNSISPIIFVEFKNLAKFENIIEVEMFSEDFKQFVSGKEIIPYMENEGLIEITTESSVYLYEYKKGKISLKKSHLTNLFGML